ncbi:hypothetical protein H0H87_006376, partial [Tephrocybe sp. NHM501043]
MDRPLGPRQPPDKRHTAYEDIFGRPGASHHTPPPPNIYPQQYLQPPDKRSSYSSHHAPSIYNQQSSTPYRQQYSPQHYPQHIPGSYAYPGPQAQPPHPHPAVARARSMMSSHGASMRPEESPEETHARNGLSAAQAYQAQIYSNGPQAERNSYQASVPTSSSHNGPIPRPSDIPRIGVSLDHNDGRLSLDFAALSVGATGPPSDQGTDEDSELPWARSDRAGIVDSPTSEAAHPVYTEPHYTASLRSSVASAPSPSLSDHSVTLVNHPSTSSRRSLESVGTLSKFSGARRDRAPQDRSMSMSAATTPSVRTLAEQKRLSRPPVPSSIHDGGRSSPASVRVRKTPIVYPALLSRVAEAFRDRIPVADKVKDGLTYKDAFDGREAVDKIAYIIKTTDRNLALLLGRALDAQKFFHDVTYDHRLRDSASELYQFRTILPSPFVSGELVNGEEHGVNLNDLPSPTGAESSAEEKSDGSPLVPTRPRKGSIGPDDVPLPSGVFTLLTDCYSPTCSRDQLCYSIACPRRLEQQSRLNMKPQPGLSKQISRESLGDEPGTLWIHSVPQEIVNSVSDAEKRRQEAINEVIYTERDFVRDMEYLRDTWIGRLKDSDVIPTDRKTDFLAQVFWNLHDIIAVNTRLRDALNKRQKS